MDRDLSIRDTHVSQMNLSYVDILAALRILVGVDIELRLIKKNTIDRCALRSSESSTRKPIEQRSFLAYKLKSIHNKSSPEYSIVNCCIVSATFFGATYTTTTGPRKSLILASESSLKVSMAGESENLEARRVFPLRFHTVITLGAALASPQNSCVTHQRWSSYLYSRNVRIANIPIIVASAAPCSTLASNYAYRIEASVLGENSNNIVSLFPETGSTICLGPLSLTRRSLANRTTTAGHGRVIERVIEHPDDHDRETWVFTVLHRNWDPSMLQFQEFTTEYVVNIWTLLRLGTETFATGNVVHIEGNVVGFNDTTSTFSIRVSDCDVRHNDNNC
ncbi:uncharacterized protein MELLADRAFT_69482 [Melampsora larici-populina 98AG31]|uniref:Uncharacterized protein n=1 Tax=Melampsora larici-populina (strain 98AG31 / pathotype 3-4-7) TaxID=747676 RepID=F4SAW9_MELLP|nr:uncharacterized protein MELLADRAFT_69482 [Melampsora larici-populina 98AG31]EGF98180.1 hypothetical protein MELLADRAFT_69482 [Melampsora larici-populina 98AG31]